jgi:hypothetical protein
MCIQHARMYEVPGRESPALNVKLSQAEIVALRAECRHLESSSSGFRRRKTMPPVPRRKCKHCGLTFDDDATIQQQIHPDGAAVPEA